MMAYSGVTVAAGTKLMNGHTVGTVVMYADTSAAYTREDHRFAFGSGTRATQVARHTNDILTNRSYEVTWQAKRDCEPIMVSAFDKLAADVRDRGLFVSCTRTALPDRTVRFVVRLTRFGRAAGIHEDADGRKNLAATNRRRQKAEGTNRPRPLRPGL